MFRLKTLIVTVLLIVSISPFIYAVDKCPTLFLAAPYYNDASEETTYLGSFQLEDLPLTKGIAKAMDFNLNELKDFFKSDDSRILGQTLSPEEIYSLTHILGHSVSEIEQNMRPKKYSQAGFLGRRESLRDVLAKDSAFVISKGLTHRELSNPLRQILQMFFKNKKTEITFYLEGVPYYAWWGRTKGGQPSPFSDPFLDGYGRIEIVNLANKKKLRFGDMLPGLIAYYGFYEGTESFYRLEPSEILKLFPFLNKKRAK